MLNQMPSNIGRKVAARPLIDRPQLPKGFHLKSGNLSSTARMIHYCAVCGHCQPNVLPARSTTKDPRQQCVYYRKLCSLRFSQSRMRAGRHFSLNRRVPFQTNVDPIGRSLGARLPMDRPINSPHTELVFRAKHLSCFACVLSTRKFWSDLCF